PRLLGEVADLRPRVMADVSPLGVSRPVEERFRGAEGVVTGRRSDAFHGDAFLARFFGNFYALLVSFYPFLLIQNPPLVGHAVLFRERGKGKVAKALDERLELVEVVAVGERFVLTLLEV